MKKFFITLLILIILAGAAFFFGWANFSVPPGAYGIISSKTHGIDPKIVKAGEFRWIWYKLIPTNVTISVYKLDNLQFPVNFNSSLPSGDVYSQFAGINANFSYELQGNISFSINPEHLLTVISKNNITNQEELDKFTLDTAEKIKLAILNYIARANPEEIEQLLSVSRNSISNMENAVKSGFPEIINFAVNIDVFKYPDFILYREIRAIYEEFLEEQRRAVASTFGQRADSHIQSQLRFSELEKYGELLTKYPVLLDYLAIQPE